MSGILELNGEVVCQPADTLCGRPAPVHREQSLRRAVDPAGKGSRRRASG